LPFKEVNSGMCANLVGVCQRDNENLCWKVFHWKHYYKKYELKIFTSVY
jgi:hypothetical protein